MKMAFKRGLIVVLGVLLQVFLYMFLYLYLGEHIAIINIFYYLIGIVIILELIRDSKSYSYTLPWIVIILLFPVVGSLLYLIIGTSKRRSKTLKNIKEAEKEYRKYYVTDKKLINEIKDKSHLKYLTDYSKFALYDNSNVSYYPLGEEVYKEMLKELKQAKKFIFIEYFIISTGSMWNSILSILEEKVKGGVEVRVIYDDLGCLKTLPNNYNEVLESKGIKCIVFNPLKPSRGFIMNNRDHRKILVIDGNVAFSGGINLSDEYINLNKRFGHWKDNGIKITGDAVWSYTIMFLTIWNAYIKEDKDFTRYKYEFKDSKKTGYVLPYSETPLDDEVTSEDVYINIISRANNYLYIFTPYLVLDTDLINSLVLASKRGVDVRIVIPGIPDKKIVYSLSESYIEPLMKGGVKVYKYTPGFVHAKVFVSDDKVATVGTINLDYRSLYLNFECGLYMEEIATIKDIKKDLEDTISKSKLVSNKEGVPKLAKAVWQAILRLIAPLM